MLKVVVASMLLVVFSALMGCALPEGYHRDSADYYSQPSDSGGGHGSHGGHSH